MADERKITTVFEANIDQFNAATQKLNSDMKGINAQFNNATASLGKWSDSQDGLKAKLEQLNKTLKVQQNALNDSKSKFNDLVAAGKENTKEAQNLAKKILDQETAVKKTTKSIDDYSDSLKELEDAGVKTRKELDKLNKEQEEVKQKANDLKNAIGKGLVVGIAGIATACIGAVKGLSSIVENTKELRTQLGQLETSFASNELSAEAATKTYDELYSVLGDSGKATEASMHLGQLVKDEKDLEGWTNILTGVYATFGDSLPVEGLSEAINHSSKLGSVQSTLADALEWSGINVDDFNEKLEGLNTEEERAKLINETLQGIYGETANKYKEVNKDVIEANKAQNEYNQKMAELGDKVQPAMNQFKLVMVEALTKVMDTFSSTDIEGLMNNIAKIVSTFVTDILPPLMSGLSWVLDNMNWLAPAIGAVASAILIYNGVTKAMEIATKLAKIQQIGLNAAFLANPIGLVVIAITGLVAAFVILWKKCEGFRNFWKGLWEGVKKTASLAKDFIVKLFEGIANIIKAPFNAVISLINGAIGAINKIKVDIPDWVPKYGGKTIGFNIPTIPKLAKGGIIDQPTLAMVGEAGKEAIMPLENNTQWIDKLADKLSNKVNNQNVVNNYNFDYKFEKMETSKIALHKAQLETKRIVGGH